MTVALTLTAAGRAALVDAAHRSTRAVQLRRLAIGTGTAPAGTDESARTALRVQREIVAVTGSTAVPARIAIRADYAPDAAYSVTEVGLFARIGDAGAEFLAAYWAAPDTASALAATVSGTALVVAGIVEITASAAEITVTPALTIQVGAPGAATTATRGLVELATDAEARTGTDTERAVTPAALDAALDALPAATTATRGLVELATDAEARTGTDTERAVTPAALDAALDALPAATTATRGLVELATDAEARTGTDTERAVTPAALDAALDALGVTMQTILSGPFILAPQQQAQRVAQTPIAGYRWLDVLAATDPDGNGRWTIGQPVRVPVAALLERAYSQTSTLLMIDSVAARLRTVDVARDTATLRATLRPAAARGRCAYGMGWHAGQLWLASAVPTHVVVGTVDLNSHTETRVGDTGVDVTPGKGLGLASHAGALYLSVGGYLYTLDTTTGVASRASVPFGVDPTGRGLASHGGALYMAGQHGASHARIYTINTATGAATLAATLAVTSAEGGMALASHGGALYLLTGVSSRRLYRITPGNPWTVADLGVLAGAAAGTTAEDDGLSTALLDVWGGALAYDVVPAAGTRLEVWRRTGAANTVVFRNAGPARVQVVQIIGVT